MKGNTNWHKELKEEIQEDQEKEYGNRKMWKVDWQHSKNKRKSKTNTEGKAIPEALKQWQSAEREIWRVYKRKSQSNIEKKKGGQVIIENIIDMEDK